MHAIHPTGMSGRSTPLSASQHSDRLLPVLPGQCRPDSCSNCLLSEGQLLTRQYRPLAVGSNLTQLRHLMTAGSPHQPVTTQPFGSAHKS